MLRAASVLMFGAALALFAQTATPKRSVAAARKKASPVPSALTNRDIIRLVQAKISDDLIVVKIRHSKTKFDTSPNGLVALKEAGVSDHLAAVMIDPAGAPPPPTRPPAPTPVKPSLPPPETGAKPVIPTVTGAVTTKRGGAPKAPANFGVYIEDRGELKPLGRIRTKVRISRFRTLLKNVVPFAREKIDVNIPGAHSTNRYETLRPTFYAFLPQTRDVSKFKLLQAKITGQGFDQRTIADASVLFSPEQNQDEIPCDIGPAGVQGLYRITPREDLAAGEFGFVEGNTGSKPMSNIEVIDVYDFGVDRKEDKYPLSLYLDTLPPARLADAEFLTWSKEEAQRIVTEREGKTGITGGPWFKRQYGSLDVYWADTLFAKAFARLEMLDRNLTPDQASKLSGLLTSPDNGQYYIVVSIGGKVGSGRLMGANEGERMMRPFDAWLSADRGKDGVRAKKLEFLGGYAGLWKVTFDKAGIRRSLLQSDPPELVFEARLNQNLDFKAKFEVARVDAR